MAQSEMMLISKVFSETVLGLLSRVANARQQRLDIYNPYFLTDNNTANGVLSGPDSFDSGLAIFMDVYLGRGHAPYSRRYAQLSSERR